ncbi:MAG: hypothetical protein AB7P14_25315, partial [Blastocatellales bacterium]
MKALNSLSAMNVYEFSSLNRVDSLIDFFWFFGNRCPSLPQLVVALCECSAPFQIKANAAEEIANVAQAVT